MIVELHETSPRRGRPPKMLEDADVPRRLLRVGIAHLTERGYSSASLDAILSEANVPKGGFYHYFDSKAGFGLALVEAYDRYFLALLSRSFDNETLVPMDRLRAFTRDAEAGMARHDFRRGCLIGNLGQEMGVLPEAFRARLTTVLEGWQCRTAALLRAAQAAGAIRADHDADALASFFWIGWEGAVLRAKLERKAAPLASFAACFFELIEKSRSEVENV